MKAILRIVRLPNVITAASNSLAGAFCAGVALKDWPTLAGLAFVSMAIYASGILFNDLFDLEEDRRERPERPLPSGAVSVLTVAILGVVLMAAGAAVAWALGIRVGLVGSLLVASVLGYDLGLKRTAIGPWVMGLCRGANFGLGVAAASAIDVRLVAAAAGYVIYVAGVTYVSRQETYDGRTAGVRAGFVFMISGIGAVLLEMILITGFLLDPASLRFASWPVVVAIWLLFLLIKSLAGQYSAILAEPCPRTIGGMVKAGIISLPLIDFALTLALAGLPKASVIALLWLAARATARRLYTT